MKIRSVKITSFGKYRDWSITDIPDGLTLITGNNESGKTTLMEFMRSTMFPSSKRSYPSPAKTDAGSMEIETESGERMTIIREQRKTYELHNGKLPNELFAMDSDTYRSIFAMDLKDLTDGDAISSDSIRKRFLTIPGGEAVPQVIKDIGTMRKELMNDDRHTDNNPIGSLLNRLNEINASIADHRDGDSVYDRYAEESSAIRAKLKQLTGMQEILDREKIRHDSMMQQIPNLRRMDELASEISELEYSRALTKEIESDHHMCIQRISELNGSLEEMGEFETISVDELNSHRELLGEMRSYLREEDALSTAKEKMKDLIAEDEELLDQLGIDPELATEERRTLIQNRMGRRTPWGLLVAVVGAAIAGAGVYLDTSMMMIAGAGVAVAGAVMFALLGGKGTEKWMVSQGYSPIPRNRIQSFIEKLEMVDSASKRISDNRSKAGDIDERIRKMESVAAEVMDMIGEPYTDVKDAHDVLEMYIASEERKIRKAERVTEMIGELDGYNERMNELTDMFGGSERFAKACTDRKALDEKEAELAATARSIETATGMSAEEVRRESEKEFVQEDLGNDISGLRERIGELREKMESHVADRSMGDMLAERNAMMSELRDKAREWAVLSLEERMIDTSCSELYSKMQPSVISTANRYLQMMTRGRYTIDPDPRSEEVVIRDSVSHKTAREWSSGLGDQVYLSIKMAVAKEMGSERLPMILDDILVRFDNERRMGACSAILDFAKDQQVFLFSCDSTVESSFSPGTVFNKVRL